MIKKTYVQPTMKVVELDMADIVCESPDGKNVTGAKGNAGLFYIGGNTIGSSDEQRANRRGIWDED